MAVTNKQTGSFLIEFILVAAIVLVLAIWGSSQLTAKAKTLQAQALANWMLIAQSGIQNYLDKEYLNVVDIISTNGIGNFNQELKPSWLDLKQAGFINQAWDINGPAKQKLSYMIDLIGDCAQNNCSIQALIHTDNPVYGKDNQADLSFIADWLLAANGKGLVYRLNNGTGAFKSAGISLAMLNHTFQNGILALLVQKDVFGMADLNNDSGVDDNTSFDSDDFVQIRDSRNPDLQANLTVQGEISSKSHLKTSQGLIIEGTKQINQFCQKEGEITVNSSFPSLLVCKNGTRQVASYPRAGGYMTNTKRGCKNILGQSTANPVTGQCNCPSNHTNVQIAEGGSLTDPNGINMGYICLIK